MFRMFLISSYSINDIIKMQLYAQNTITPNNYFTRYTLLTVVYWALPIIQKFGNMLPVSVELIATIKVLAMNPDIKPRIPWNWRNLTRLYV